MPNGSRDSADQSESDPIDRLRECLRESKRYWSVGHRDKCLDLSDDESIIDLAIKYFGDEVEGADDLSDTDADFRPNPSGTTHHL